MNDGRDRVRWFLWSCMLALGVAMIVYGCRSPAPKAPTPLRAPPPAYGHKVV